jgi:hypothetical protein
MAAVNGVWVLDSAKSDGTDKLLTAQGVGWIKRQVTTTHPLLAHGAHERCGRAHTPGRVT